MKTAILNEEDQKIVEELAGKFGVSEYDVIHESLMLYYKIVKIDELEDLYDEDRITDEEYFELCSLHAYWSKAGQRCPRYQIEEYEMT